MTKKITLKKAIEETQEVLLRLSTRVAQLSSQQKSHEEIVAKMVENERKLIDLVTNLTNKS